MRAFLAIELPQAARRAVAEFAAGLPATGVRWVPETNLHLTLRFLGDLDPGRVTPLVAAVQVECGDIAAFRVRLAGFGGFPSLGRPRVLWIGVAPGPGRDAMVTLARRVDRGLERWGLPPENRAYTPHVTIGRVRRPSSTATLEEVPFAGPVVDVTAVTLLESRPPGKKAGAPEYIEQARIEIDASR